MEPILCFTAGLVMIASAVGLAFLRAPTWTFDIDATTASGRALERLAGIQQSVRRWTNFLLGITGALVTLSAFIPRGRGWMALWCLILIALLSALMLAAVDAILSVVGYRKAVPEAARRALASRDIYP